MLCDVDVVVVVVGRTRPRSMPLAILTMRKELNGFYLYFYMHARGSACMVMELRLAALQVAEFGYKINCFLFITGALLFHPHNHAVNSIILKNITLNFFKMVPILVESQSTSISFKRDKT